MNILVCTMALYFNNLFFKFSLVFHSTSYHLFALVAIFVLKSLEPLRHIVNIIQMENLIYFIIERFRPCRKRIFTAQRPCTYFRLFGFGTAAWFEYEAKTILATGIISSIIKWIYSMFSFLNVYLPIFPVLFFLFFILNLLYYFLLGNKNSLFFTSKFLITFYSYWYLSHFPWKGINLHSSFWCRRICADHTLPATSRRTLVHAFLFYACAMRI